MPQSKSEFFYEKSIAIIVTTGGNAYAVTFTIHQLTNNNAHDDGPSLHNGTVAWYGKDGTDYEIYYWDGNSTTQVTDNGSNDIWPSHYDGTIAWIRGGSIIYWDGNVTTSVGSGYYPSLYNGTIAWRGFDSEHNDMEIHYWDGATVTQVTNDSYYDWSPSLHNGTIAWENEDKIYFWDGSTIVYLGIGPNFFPANGTLSCYDGTVAWRSNYGIEYWDGNTTTLVLPNVAGRLWNDHPSLYNGTIAWEAWDGNDFEIYYWDGSEITQVTNNNTYDGLPSLYNGNIAYVGWDGNDKEIYYAVSTQSNQPPVADANGPYSGNEGSAVSFNGTGSYDLDGTIVSYEWDLDNDGQYDDATGETPSATWDDDYSVNIGLKVTDDGGQQTLPQQH